MATIAEGVPESGKSCTSESAMASPTYDVAVIGGGIVGLAVALQLSQLSPGCRIVVVEKETELAVHQTGHNSGVIHSGIYYRPGSQKARFCVDGGKLLAQFCDDNGIGYERCGKVIVAPHPVELDRLEELYKRGMANGVEGLEMVGPERLKEIEPFAAGIKALHASRTGIVDFKQVAQAYGARLSAAGVGVLTGTRVMRITRSEGLLFLETDRNALRARHLINCGGLYADRVARMMGIVPGIRIVPFRGEYYVLRPQSGHMVNGLIYPVPDPNLPFLGVHFTRTIHGEVEAGPNAVLALAREGYRKTSFNAAEAWNTLSYAGFWKMSRRFWRVGIGELRRSFSKAKFVRDLQRLLPAVQAEDVIPGGAGVRAQAVDSSGALLDDFCIEQTRGAIHVLNAPSPGATASLSIGRYVADLAVKSFDLPR